MTRQHPLAPTRDRPSIKGDKYNTVVPLQGQAYEVAHGQPRQGDLPPEPTVHTPAHHV